MKAAPGLKPEDLLNEIKEISNVSAVEVVEIEKPTLVSHSYFVSLQNNYNLNKVRNITGVSTIRI